MIQAPPALDGSEVFTSSGDGNTVHADVHRTLHALGFAQDSAGRLARRVTASPN